MSNGVPGIRTAQSTGDFPPLVLGYGETIPGGIIIDASQTRDYGNTGDTHTIRRGFVLKRDSDGKYSPAILGVLGTSYTSGTTLTVGVVAAQTIAKAIGASGTLWICGHTAGTAVGDVDAELVTFSAVNTTAGTLTITALTGDFDAGSALLAFQPVLLGGSGGAAGVETGFALLGDMSGVRVTDEDEVDLDAQVAHALIGGYIDASAIILRPTLTKVDTVLLHNFSAATRLMFDKFYGG